MGPKEGPFGGMERQNCSECITKDGAPGGLSPPFKFPGRQASESVFDLTEGDSLTYHQIDEMYQTPGKMAWLSQRYQKAIRDRIRAL
eukprot:3978061-Pyramimonas_sp.AAC.1